MNYAITWKSKKKTGALNLLAGYQDMLCQCDTSGDIALTITKREVADTASNNQEDNDKGGSCGQKKSKKSAKLSAEQVLEEAFITKLEGKFGHCNDQQCSLPQCWVSDDGMHINLTPLHLRTWAGAIAANIPGCKQYSGIYNDTVMLYKSKEQVTMTK
ncbi:hypothetical protein BT96DRAFT_948913 [Gymnopus androsaceus JB14]|uniref:Uncharacterized protein n=1 Tax=Gymnopus androsaceus JB14 TaxID=1447944 RepID=A0A6A4GN16_9AGAR|nr:hypothetical protein BT96DRAFT_948913 [Gymnopus androsaceus JB14]